MARFAVSDRSLYWSKTSSIEGGDRFWAREEVRGRGGEDDMILMLCKGGEQRRGGEKSKMEL